MELGIIALLAVLLFGNRLPGLARSLGSSIVEFKKGFKHGVEDPVQEVKKEFHDVTREGRSMLESASSELNGNLRDLENSVRKTTTTKG